MVEARFNPSHEEVLDHMLLQDPRVRPGKMFECVNGFRSTSSARMTTAATRTSSISPSSTWTHYNRADRRLVMLRAHDHCSRGTSSDLPPT